MFFCLSVLWCVISEYEKRIAYVNSELMNDLESVFLYSNVAFGNVSSSLVREILSCNGDISKFVPEYVLHQINLLNQVKN